MPLIISSFISRCFCILIIAIFIELPKNSVNCLDNLLFRVATKSRRYANLPMICDDEYISKYMPRQPETETIGYFNSKTHPDQMLNTNLDIALLQNDDGVRELMNHQNYESPNFINHLLNEIRRSRKPRRFNFTDANFPGDPDNAINVSQKFGRKRTGRKLRKIKNLEVRRSNNMNSEISDRFRRNTNSHFRSTKRKNPRKQNWRLNNVEEYQIKPYNMLDTFGKMFDSRRGIPTEFQRSLRRAGWSEDSCKSMRRIVGGYSVTSSEELPYMAFVDTGCGGAIIHNIWVLTAAHCADEEKPSYVYVGSLDLLNGCQYNIEEAYLHPNFSGDHLEYDIALLKITPSFIYSPAIKPILLSDSPAQNETCGIVAGWGATQYQGMQTETLQVSMLPIVSKDMCNMFNVSKEQFCAGFKDARADTCQGDSGGPFVVNDVVVGIVSFGFQCATPEIPGVYVDISYHRNWIRDVSGI